MEYEWTGHDKISVDSTKFDVCSDDIDSCCPLSAMKEEFCYVGKNAKTSFFGLLRAGRKIKS